ASSRESLGPLLRHATTPALLVATAAGALALGFVEPLVATSLGGHASATTIGLVFGAAALGSALAFPLAGRLAERRGSVPVIATSLLLAAAAAVALASSAGVVAATASLVALSVALAGVLAPTATLVAALADATTPPAYGAAFALYNVAYTAGLLLGPSVGGVLAARAGVPRAERALAAVLVLIGAWLWTQRRAVAAARPAS
ncbi:MAG: MFS transporter, partial [Myxococcales bacterium]